MFSSKYQILATQHTFRGFCCYLSFDRNTKLLSARIARLTWTLNWNIYISWKCDISANLVRLPATASLHGGRRCFIVECWKFYELMNDECIYLDLTDQIQWLVSCGEIIVISHHFVSKIETFLSCLVMEFISLLLSS